MINNEMVECLFGTSTSTAYSAVRVREGGGEQECKRVRVRARESQREQERLKLLIRRYIIYMSSEKSMWLAFLQKLLEHTFCMKMGKIGGRMYFASSTLVFWEETR